ncbi:MAG: PaaI family thioesterase [Clostridiales bacterium]|nr:PaaI family thioesterase [Clostridiales bacterium]
MSEEEARLIQQNQFIKLCGIQLLEDPEGSYYAQARVTPQVHNPYGIVHGGLLYTMADMVSGATARQYGPHPVTLDSDLHFLRNVSSGTLTARAEPVRVGGSVAVLRARVCCGDELLAEGTFTFFYRREKKQN